MLVAKHGLRGVTMSQIAEETGIGRATLYKYFPDVDAILTAWHERQINAHLDQLARLADRTTDPGERLEAVLEGYALIQHEVAGHHGSELETRLHGGEHLAQAQQHLSDFVRELLTAAAQAGAIRNDVGADELAAYSLHALGGAAAVSSKAAVRRLVGLTLAGLRPGA